jgi:hypothetical protein
MINYKDRYKATNHIRKTLITNAWRWISNKNEVDYRNANQMSNSIDFETIKKLNWNTEFASLAFDGIEDEFTKLMRGKLIQGYYRYNYGTKPVSDKRWNYMDSIKVRWYKFNETNNIDFLIDLANYCLLTYTLNNNRFKVYYHYFEFIDNGLNYNYTISIIDDYINLIFNKEDDIIPDISYLYKIAKSCKILYNQIKDNVLFHYTVEDDTIHTSML